MPAIRYRDPRTGQTIPVSAPGGGGGGMTPRQTAQIISGSIATGVHETGVVTLAPSYRLLRVATSVPARIRLYSNTAARTSDINRAPTLDPTGDSGVMFDMVTTVADLDWTTNPVVDGVLDPAGSAVPYTVTNMSGATTAVTVTLTWVPTEA